MKSDSENIAFLDVSVEKFICDYGKVVGHIPD